MLDAHDGRRIQKRFLLRRRDAVEGKTQPRILGDPAAMHVGHVNSGIARRPLAVTMGSQVVFNERNTGR